MDWIELKLYKPWLEKLESFYTAHFAHRSASQTLQSEMIGYRKQTKDRRSRSQLTPTAPRLG